MAITTIEGKLLVIKPTVSVGNNGFEKREFVIQTEEQYPQKIQIELQQGKCPDLDGYAEGDSVKVSYNLRGRDWTNNEGETKYFNTIVAWKIEGDKSGATPTPTAAPQTAGKKYVHLDKNITEAAYKQAGWNNEQLVAAGHGKFETVSAPAPATPPPAAAPAPDEDLPF